MGRLATTLHLIHDDACVHDDKVNLESKRLLCDRKHDEAGNPCYYVIDDDLTTVNHLGDGKYQWDFVWRWNEIFVLSFGSGFGGTFLASD